MKSIRQFLESSGYRRVALRKINSNHYCLTATVNGVPGLFILDTGASESCIGDEVVEKFGLEITGHEMKAGGVGSAELSAELSAGNTLTIGGRTRRNTTLAVIDLSHVNSALEQTGSGPVDGIIGAETLKSLRAVIDYGRNCLYLK